MSYAKKEEHEREKTLNELMTDLSVEVRDLFRQEMLLAKNEMSAKISRGVNDMTIEEWTIDSYRVNTTFRADVFSK